MRFGLRAKFVAAIVVIYLAIFGGIAGILIHQDSHRLRDDLNAKSKLFATLATQPIGLAFLTYQDSGQIKITQAITSFTDLNPEISNVVIADASGKIVFGKKTYQTTDLSAADASSFTTVLTYNPGGIITRIVSPLLEDNGAHRYNLVYYASSATVEATIRRAEVSILLFALFGLAVSVITTYLLISLWFLDPIQRVSRQALLISSGQLGQQIDVSSQDEVGDLAKSLNTMADSLKADIAKLEEVDRLKNEFLMITSHNLRTPLTIINGYMDSLKEFKVSAELRQILDTMTVSGKRLSAFAEDMLSISEIEANNTTLDREPTDLTKLLTTMATDFQILAKNKGVKFTNDITIGETQADTSAAHMRSAIWNLLDNALKFTDKGGWIKLAAKKDSRTIEISVSDSGIGIAKAEMPKLFTKFHRGTSTLEYQYEGTGIGLYATKLVIERLGGTIRAESELGHGASFTIALPLLAAPKDN